MQRFALLLVLFSLAMTLGWLWKSEEISHLQFVAESEIDLPAELTELLLHMSPDERARFIDLVKQDLQSPEVRWHILTEEESEQLRNGLPRGEDGFLLPTNMMYRSDPVFQPRTKRWMNVPSLQPREP